MIALLLYLGVAAACVVRSPRCYIVSAVREGSREQTGCFLATLMALSAILVLRGLLRNMTPPGVASSNTQVLLAVGLAIIFIVCALFVLRLNRNALIVYGAALLLGVLVASRYDPRLAVSLTIAGVVAGVVTYARRDVL